MQTSGAARRENAKLYQHHCDRGRYVHYRLKLLISETLPSR